MQLDTAWIEQTWSLTQTRLGSRLGDNDVFEVEAIEGRFILKVAGSWTTRDRITWTTELLTFLDRRHCPWVPRVVATAGGDRVAQVGERFAYLMERVVGVPVRGSPMTFARFGTLLADINAVAGLPESPSTGFENSRRAMLDAAPMFAFGNEYADLVRAMPRWDNLDIPMALVHPDYHLGQVLQRPDGGWVIVDWNDAGIGRRVFGLGYPLILEFVGPALEILEAEGRAFYAAYAERIRMEEIERRYLIDAALVPALSFMRFTKDRDLAWKKIQFAVRHRDALLAMLPCTARCTGRCARVW